MDERHYVGVDVHQGQCVGRLVDAAGAVVGEGAVTKLEPIREVEQRLGGTTRVRNHVLKDGTGEVSLVLWGQETDLVSEGDVVRIADGWVKDYRGQIQISLERSGKLEKV